MRRTFQCEECRTVGYVPSGGIKTAICARCGDVYFCDEGRVTRRVYPALHMFPIDVEREPNYPFSKWMPTHTRPIMAGLYHLRFRHTEPNVIVAWWDGHCFRDRRNGVRLVMTQFLTWRGVLA